MLNQRYFFYVCFFIALSAVLLPQWSFAFTAKKSPVGMLTFGYVNETERLDIAVWFPAINKNRKIQYGEIQINASRTRYVLPGSYPILLLSHDVAGSRFDHHDIATALAEKGFIVIAPNHLYDTATNSDMAFSAVGLYTRPRHLLRALEVVLSQPELAPYADESRIGVIGVGYGSITALQMVGLVPDLELIEEKCVTQSITGSFCSPWVFSRLQQAKNKMRMIIEQEGSFAFKPNLTLFAPNLISVAVPEGKKIESEKMDTKLSFLSRFSSEKKRNEERKALNTTLAEKKALPELVNEKNGDVDSETETDVEINSKVDTGLDTEENSEGSRERNATNNDDEPFFLQPTIKNFLQNSFQVTTFYGASTGGSSFFPQAFAVTPHFELLRTEPQQLFKAAIPVKLRQKNPVYRRPAFERAIRSVALIAPAAGAVYQDITGSLPQSVAIIEAQKDEVYPPVGYSTPLYTRREGISNESIDASKQLTLPHLLQLEKTDHYSLFAKCSDDIQESLEAICGRTSSKERNQLHEKRDKFLVDFFQTTLGTPSVEIPPSGFIADE